MDIFVPLTPDTTDHVERRPEEEEELCGHCGEGKGGRGIVWTL